MRVSETIPLAYQRLLARPELQALAARFGLNRDVHYQFVGERRSFHGKAITVEGQQWVRLPANDRPEPYLLLTLLHEWAHLLVHRHKKRRREPPHGELWREHFLSLVQAAVNAGFFPGNELEVARHAAAGEVSTASACLLDTNGKPLQPVPARPIPRFKAGDEVCFLDREGRAHEGTVRRVNTRTYTVDISNSAMIYRVPIGYPLLNPVDEPIGSAVPPPKWQVGMRVRFTDLGGHLLTGEVLRVNQKTLTLDASDGRRYRVGYGHPNLREA